MKFKIRVKCHFSPCGLGHFVSLVQMFHFSPVGPKRFHRCHFSPLGYFHPFFLLTRWAIW
ncbi:hypothetical protein Hanom_Chr02g00174351 [Helianthus anomalus]